MMYILYVYINMCMYIYLSLSLCARPGVWCVCVRVDLHGCKMLNNIETKTTNSCLSLSWRIWSSRCAVPPSYHVCLVCVVLLHVKARLGSAMALSTTNGQGQRKKTHETTSSRHSRPTHPPGRLAPFCLVVSAASMLLSPGLFGQLCLACLPGSSKLFSCAKLISSLTLSRDWWAASHLLHLLVDARYLGVSITLTFFSAKCQPHHVSQLAKERFHEALRTLCEVFPFFPVKTAQHWPGVGGFWYSTTGLTLGGLSSQLCDAGLEGAGVAGIGVPGFICRSFVSVFLIPRYCIEWNLLQCFLDVPEHRWWFPSAPACPYVHTK